MDMKRLVEILKHNIKESRQQTVDSIQGWEAMPYLPRLNLSGPTTYFLLLFGIALSISALFVRGVWAQEVNDKVGTTGFNFLKIDNSARSAAFGSAFAAVAEDINSIVWNPGAMATIENKMATASFTNYLVDTQSGFVGLAFPLKNRATFGIGISYISYGTFDKTDENGIVIGDFGAGDLAARVSYSRFTSDKVSVGGNLKFIFSRIDEFSSDAYALDLGIFIRPRERTTLGVSILNLGFVRSGFSEDLKDSLPVNLKIGITHKPEHLPLMIVVDANLPNDNDLYFSIGGEFEISQNFMIRPGYSSVSNGLETGEGAGISAGAGFVIDRYRFDYAFSSFADLGEVHRFSLTGEFK